VLAFSEIEINIQHFCVCNTKSELSDSFRAFMVDEEIQVMFTEL
jgi:hypothetical protein